ncbi:MAG: Lcl domain-containing protein [Sulfuricaulis sp.]
MKFHHRWLVMSLFVGVMGVSSSAHAALYSRLGGAAVYDSDFNITWLADANYANTSGYIANGLNSWANAYTWATNLTVDGVSGWRLPTTVQPDATCSSQNAGTSWGDNCTGSELGHLFYTELHGVAGQSILTTHNSFYNLFTNVQNDAYWSATEAAPDPGFAWGLNFSSGFQYGYNEADTYYAWAVHSGDVAVVPLPAAVWLFGSGLLGLIGIARRQPTQANRGKSMNPQQ